MSNQGTNLQPGREPDLTRRIEDLCAAIQRELRIPDTSRSLFRITPEVQRQVLQELFVHDPDFALLTACVLRIPREDILKLMTHPLVLATHYDVLSALCSALSIREAFIPGKTESHEIYNFRSTISGFLHRGGYFVDDAKLPEHPAVRPWHLVDGLYRLLREERGGDEGAPLTLSSSFLGDSMLSFVAPRKERALSDEARKIYWARHFELLDAGREGVSVTTVTNRDFKKLLIRKLEERDPKNFEATVHRLLGKVILPPTLLETATRVALRYGDEAGPPNSEARRDFEFLQKLWPYSPRTELLKLLLEDAGDVFDREKLDQRTLEISDAHRIANYLQLDFKAADWERCAATRIDKATLMRAQDRALRITEAELCASVIQAAVPFDEALAWAKSSAAVTTVSDVPRGELASCFAVLDPVSRDVTVTSTGMIVLDHTQPFGPTTVQIIVPGLRGDVAYPGLAEVVSQPFEIPAASQIESCGNYVMIHKPGPQGPRVFYRGEECVVPSEFSASVLVSDSLHADTLVLRYAPSLPEISDHKTQVVVFDDGAPYVSELREFREFRHSDGLPTLGDAILLGSAPRIGDPHCSDLIFYTPHVGFATIPVPGVVHQVGLVSGYQPGLMVLLVDPKSQTNVALRLHSPEALHSLRHVMAEKYFASPHRLTLHQAGELLVIAEDTNRAGTNVYRYTPDKPVLLRRGSPDPLHSIFSAGANVVFAFQYSQTLGTDARYELQVYKSKTEHLRGVHFVVSFSPGVQLGSTYLFSGRMAGEVSDSILVIFEDGRLGTAPLNPEGYSKKDLVGAAPVTEEEFLCSLGDIVTVPTDGDKFIAVSERTTEKISCYDRSFEFDIDDPRVLCLEDEEGRIIRNKTDNTLWLRTPGAQKLDGPYDLVHPFGLAGAVVGNQNEDSSFTIRTFSASARSLTYDARPTVTSRAFSGYTLVTILGVRGGRAVVDQLTVGGWSVPPAALALLPSLFEVQNMRLTKLPARDFGDPFLPFGALPSVPVVPAIRSDEARAGRWANLLFGQFGITPAHSTLSRLRVWTVFSGSPREAAAPSVSLFQAYDDRSYLGAGDPRARGRGPAALQLTGATVSEYIICGRTGAWDAEQGCWRPVPLSFQSAAAPKARLRESTLTLRPEGATRLDLPVVSGGAIDPASVKLSAQGQGAVPQLRTNPDGTMRVSLAEPVESISFLVRWQAGAQGLPDQKASTESLAQYRQMILENDDPAVSGLAKKLCRLPLKLQPLSDLISGMSPLEQIRMVEREVKRIGYYDMKNASHPIQDPLQSLEVALNRALELQASGRIGQGKVIAGVCIDFALCAVVILRERGFVCGINSCFKPESNLPLVSRTYRSHHLHATVWVALPIEGTSQARLVTIDPTPSVDIVSGLRYVGLQGWQALVRGVEAVRSRLKTAGPNDSEAPVDEPGPEEQGLLANVPSSSLPAATTTPPAEIPALQIEEVADIVAAPEVVNPFQFPPDAAPIIERLLLFWRFSGTEAVPAERRRQQVHYFVTASNFGVRPSESEPAESPELLLREACLREGAGSLGAGKAKLSTFLEQLGDSSGIAEDLMRALRGWCKP